jgi:hypothetical protein
LCVLSTAFAYLTHQSCNSLLLRLNTFGHWRIFPEYHFLRTSVLSLCLELVCLLYSFLHCNVIFLYSFSKTIKKNKKIKYTPKRGWEKYFLYWQHNESPLDKAHLSCLIHQTMGCSTTLGSFARYIELCPPPFGYSSKHMESLRCLLLRRLMINRYVA